MKSNIVNVQLNELKSVIKNILLMKNVESSKAGEIAEALANSTRDGINSHGVNRLPLLIEYINKRYISISAEPKVINETDTFCQVDGNLGFGILNSIFCTDKAMEIASKNGIGLVTIKNTNHWHRAGTYGWCAAERGFILIAWTNTIPNLAPYGSAKNLIGNNPLVISIPRKEGHLVLDMALSQYSYGAIAKYARQKKELPEIGGYDENGNLTKNATAIRNNGNHLPIGFWKGSGLSIVLDLIAAILSGGKSTNELSENPNVDTGMSQVFIAIDPNKFGDDNFQQNLINNTLENFKNNSHEGFSSVRYPGQGVLERREQNLKNGIPIEKDIWERIISMAKDKTL